MNQNFDEAIRWRSTVYYGIAILCITANIMAFIFQFFYYELPCPLCLLQRFGFIGIGLGATLSLIDKPSGKYDIIIIISSLFTLAVGLRQVLLHIAVPESGYGSTFLGLHFYTWSALISFCLILLMSLVPVLNNLNILYFPPNSSLNTLIKFSFIAITFINMVANYFECGFGMCPSDPTTYLELKK